MKRKIITIIAMTLAGVMMTASLTGCGTRAEAINTEVTDMQEETIIIGDDEESDVKTEEVIIAEEDDETMSNLATEEAIAKPAEDEDTTDGNIVLYGGEKKPIKYGGINEGIGEEVNIILENVEDNIPLYSGEGRLCGYLKEGGSIEITEHCSVMTAWYRFKNPIEGTGYDYLYVQRFETVMSSDRKKFIEEELLKGRRTKVLDAPEADMECYEFSVPREDYSDDTNFLYSDEFESTQYKTFYVECTRNGDFFDYKVYYK